MLLVSAFSRRVSIQFEFSRQIFEKSTNFSFAKILPGGTEVFHVDRWT